MKKFTALLLSLLLLLCTCAFAQQEQEEILLPFDVEGYFTTGVCLAQVQPLATWEEAVAAGLPLQSEPYATANSKADDAQSPLNRQYSLTEGARITFLDLPMETAGFQFTDDHFTSFELYPVEELTLEQIVPLLTEIIGEPTEQVTNPLGMTSVRWNLELEDGQLVGLSIIAAKEDVVTMIAGAYWSLYWQLIGVTPG